jgi:hypothetical protein
MGEQMEGASPAGVIGHAYLHAGQNEDEIQLR